MAQFIELIDIGEKLVRVNVDNIDRYFTDPDDKSSTILAFGSERLSVKISYEDFGKMLANLP